MTPEEANATVEAAIAKGTAKYGGMAARIASLAQEASEPSEFENLTLIYMAEVSDWTVQLAFLVGDQRWEQCKEILPAMRRAVDKLAGAVNNLTLLKIPGASVEDLAKEWAKQEGPKR